MFNALSDEFDLEYVFVDGTVVQAHQKAAGAKGGPAARGSIAPGAADQQGRGRRGRTQLPRAVRDSSRPGARSCGRAGPAGGPSVRGLGRRQGLRRGVAARGRGGDSLKTEPDGAPAL